jgi:hypothetical protein
MTELRSEPRLPFPVPRSPFPVPRSPRPSDEVARKPFRVPRSPSSRSPSNLPSPCDNRGLDGLPYLMKSTHPAWFTTTAVVPLASRTTRLGTPPTCSWAMGTLDRRSMSATMP